MEVYLARYPGFMMYGDGRLNMDWRRVVGRMMVVGFGRG